MPGHSSGLTRALPKVFGFPSKPTTDVCDFTSDATVAALQVRCYYYYYYYYYNLIELPALRGNSCGRRGSSYSISVRFTPCHAAPCSPVLPPSTRHSPHAPVARSAERRHHWLPAMRGVSCRVLRPGPPMADGFLASAGGKTGTSRGWLPSKYRRPHIFPTWA